VIRLPFELAPFSRITWASAAIRSTWGERLSRVRRALEDGDRPSRWEGILAARIVKIYPYREQEWVAEARGLGLDVERFEGSPGEVAADEEIQSGKAILVLAGRSEAMKQARSDGTFKALAVPDCCARQTLRAKHMALRSQEMALFLSSVRNPEPGGSAVLRQAWETNLFWRGAGIAPIPHVPCSMSCAQSTTLARDLLERMKTCGVEEEAEWLKDMLSWSLSWSALHGIAELKTPLFKMCTDTDATAERYELRLEGLFPKEAPAGVGFPYRTGASGLVGIQPGKQGF
jgi:hypothetical protein